MNEAVHVLGIAGSLRRFSVNKGLLLAAADVLPQGMSLEIYSLEGIPLYNADLTETPTSVQQFKNHIGSADALLIATPEYNYSVPGVLKNALDWASRPPKESVLYGKPLAILGAGGTMGTSRAQYHLRQIATATNMLALNKPEVAVQRAWEKFDAEGNLTDEATRHQIRALLEALQKWTIQLAPRPEMALAG